jgi:hypothetical protein
MALTTNAYIVDTTGPASSLRHYPELVQTKTFAAGSGTLAELTAVALNTSTGFMVLWAPAGANNTNVIAGFVRSPSGVTLDGTFQTQALVTMKGKIHIDDIPINTYTLAELKVACRNGMVRNAGIEIEGLENFA